MSKESRKDFARSILKSQGRPIIAQVGLSEKVSLRSSPTPTVLSLSALIFSNWPGALSRIAPLMSSAVSLKDAAVATEAGPPMNTTFDRQASPNGGLSYLIKSFMQGHEARVPDS